MRWSVYAAIGILIINLVAGVYLGEVAEYVANQATENPLRISGLCEKIASRKF